MSYQVVQYTVAEANDSISFHMASGNIASGTFKLYGLKSKVC